MNITKHFYCFIYFIAIISSNIYADKLNIGVTLHPYYSWVANIGKAHIALTPIISENSNSHTYQPRTQDMKKLNNLNGIVLNGLGHDAFINPMLRAVETDIEVISPAMLAPFINFGEKENNPNTNSHDFMSINIAASQINLLANALGKLDSKNSYAYKKNARIYNKKLRRILAESIARLRRYNVSDLTIATGHDGYYSMFEELGLSVSFVLQPKHSGKLSIRELTAIKNQFEEAPPHMVFIEKDYPNAELIELIVNQAIPMYTLTHGIKGNYSKAKFEQDIAVNHGTIVTAISEWATNQNAQR